MSASEQGMIRLRVTTPEEGAEIRVLDGQFHTLARDLGKLEIELPPGIYKVRVRAGEEVREELVTLLPGQTEVVKEFGLVPFASPMPLSETAKSHEYHAAAAHQNSVPVQFEHGHGSQVYVFARRFSLPDSSVPADGSLPNPAQGLSLLDAAGGLIADLAHQAGGQPAGGDPWAACNAALDPGFYRLSLKLPSGTVIEQPIVAVEGWQTQVFLLQRDYGPGEGEAADLQDSGIVMARIGEWFDPQRPDLRLADIARQALNRRRVFAREAIRASLSAVPANPMLGIMGAHLLLLEQDPDLPLLGELVTMLRNLIGKHPDLEALGLAQQEEGPFYPLEFPPMLRRSWSLVVEHSADTPYLVQLDTLASEIAPKVWGDSPWLLWLTPPAPKAVHPSKQAGPQAAQDLPFGPITPPKKAKAYQATDDDRSQALQQQLNVLKPKPQAQADMPAPVESGEGAPVEPSPEPELDPDEIRELTKRLGLPAANIEAMLRQRRSS